MTPTHPVPPEHQPAELVDRAAALLVARGVRRPPDTLVLLAQRLLRWGTVVKGLPAFEPQSLKPLARDFREMGFDCLPGKNPRWTPRQRAQAESLFFDLAMRVAGEPELPLPTLRLDPAEPAELARWIWNHLDHHVSALTIGLLGSRILAMTPEDPRFQAQGPLRERVVQIVGVLVAFALYLGGEHGGDMPPGQASATASALLDGLAAAIGEAFSLGGPRGRWLAHCGDWVHPVYPCPMQDYGSVLAALPSGIRP